jgi:hypothetical protein
LALRSPLFDIYDPYGILQQQAQSGLLPDAGDELEAIGVAPLGQRKPQLSDLMPEEEKSAWLKKLSEMGSSGLAGLGWIMDTPGAIVRGGLSGGLGKAVSALTDTTDERVTGRELLRQYGMVGDEDTWGNFAGGLASEVLLDPTTYLSLGLNQVLGKGAKTVAGMGAGRAGLLEGADVAARKANKGIRQYLRENTPQSLIDAAADPTLAMENFRIAAGKNADSLLNDPITRMNRLSLPGYDLGATDLFGEGIGDYVARAADQLGENAKTAPVIGTAYRWGQKAFNPDVLGFSDYDRQWEARGVVDAARRREVKDRGILSQLQFDANEALKDGPVRMGDDEYSRWLRNLAEGQVNSRADFQNYDALEQMFQSGPHKDLADYWDGYRETVQMEADRLGIPLNEFKSKVGTEFFPRQQSGFDSPQFPKYPDGVNAPSPADKRAYTLASKAAPLSDSPGLGRRDYTDLPGGTSTLNRMSLDADLQNALRGANDQEATLILQDWGSRNGFGPATTTGDPSGDLFEWATDQAQRDKLYDNLAKFVRNIDPQHAQKGVPIFGNNAFNEMATYQLRRGRAESNAEQMLKLLKPQMADQSADLVTGGVNYTAKETAQKLGFDPDTFGPAFMRELGIDNLDTVSFPKKFVDDWSQRVNKGRVTPGAEGPLGLFDDFTASFKTLALLSPARYVRDAYSGAFAAATQGAFNPLDWSAGVSARNGNYAPLLRRLKDAPGYKDLDDAEKLRKFMVESGAQGVGTSTVADEMLRGASGTQMRGSYPGAAPPTWSSIGKRFYDSERGWGQALYDYNPFAVRSGAGNRNPILELGDRAAETTDAGNRLGTYLNQVRQGVSPEEARRISDLTQVRYSPDAFTDLERDVLKRIFPFYSYTKGIVPLVADNIINRPAGLQGQSLRAINRGSEPSEDFFTPEYLRQSASVPVPKDLPFVGLSSNPNLQRFLTNIDLPYESLINLFTPGVGNTAFDKLSSSAQKSFLNILGQTNPLFKGPAELITNRQFFSGRQLSDLYSMLEQPLGSPGRILEQVGSNLPGGSRVLGTVRQIMDDRLTPAEKLSKLAVNTLTGLKFQDVDQERTKRLAARDMLNQLLETTPGVKSYENISVPDDVIRQMPEEQRRMYLLYRIVQSEAAKRARDKKKQDAILDPLQVLGITQQA